jgi:hypothetical protein
MPPKRKGDPPKKTPRRPLAEERAGDARGVRGMRLLRKEDEL